MLSVCEYKKATNYAASILYKRCCWNIEPAEIVHTAFIKMIERNSAYSSLALNKQISNAIIELRAQPKFVSIDRFEDVESGEKYLHNLLEKSDHIYSIPPKCEGKRKCCACGEILPLSSFYCNLKKNKYWTYSPYCKKCHFLKSKSAALKIKSDPRLYSENLAKNRERQKWTYEKIKNDPIRWAIYSKKHTKIAEAWAKRNQDRVKIARKKAKEKIILTLPDHYMKDLLLKRKGYSLELLSRHPELIDKERRILIYKRKCKKLKKIKPTHDNPRN